MKTALTIAGSDPTGGAGVQSDLRVFRHFGVHGISVISALTAQNTLEIKSVSAVKGSFVEAQLTALLDDIMPDAVKTGMLFSSAAIKAVAKTAKRYGLRNIVIDPVTVSSTGSNLMEEGALGILKEKLLPLAKVITPNIHEAAALSGMTVSGEKDMERASKRLKELGPEIVIITGGHFESGKGRGTNGKRRKEETLELIYDGRHFHYVRGEKFEGEYHGTGCAFSAAVAALLAKGTPVIESVQKAKEFIDSAIRKSCVSGRGMRLLNV